MSNETPSFKEYMGKTLKYTLTTKQKAVFDYIDNCKKKGKPIRILASGQNWRRQLAYWESKYQQYIDSFK